MDLAARLHNGVLHANAVALNKGCGVLILGASGSGKSALSLQLMGIGASLVADDRVVLTTDGARMIAAPVPTLKGRIEARGIGILNAASLDHCRLVLAIDLDSAETKRVPDPQQARLCDVAIPLLSAVQQDYFAAAIYQLMLSQDSA